MMRDNGLDANKLTMESIEPSARIAMLHGKGACN
jgi:hypothetical protein